MKFLLDANLSPETANFLRQLNFNVKSLIELSLGYLTDAAVMNLAKKEKRIIISFDLDFSEIFYFLERGRLGIIVLRLKDQRIENANRVLGNLIRYYELDKKSNKLNKSLVVLNENGIRIWDN